MKREGVSSSLTWITEAHGAGEMEDIRWAIFGVHTRDNKRLIVRGNVSGYTYLRNIFSSNRQTKASMSLHSNCFIICECLKLEIEQYPN